MVDESIIKKEKFVKNIKFENVSFNYDNKKNSLNDISLEIPKGSIVGISGKSGSGKSIIAFTFRIATTKSGLVSMDNLDIKKILTN